MTGAELVAVIEEDKVMREEVATDDEATTDDEAAAEDEVGAAKEVGAAEVEIVLTNRPPMMLELLLAPLTAFFR